MRCSMQLLINYTLMLNHWLVRPFFRHSVFNDFYLCSSDSKPKILRNLADIRDIGSNTCNCPSACHLCRKNDLTKTADLHLWTWPTHQGHWKGRHDFGGECLAGFLSIIFPFSKKRTIFFVGQAVYQAIVRPSSLLAAPVLSRRWFLTVRRAGWIIRSGLKPLKGSLRNKWDVEEKWEALWDCLRGEMRVRFHFFEISSRQNPEP